MLFKLPVQTKNVLVNRFIIMFNVIKFSIFLALLGILGGCATPARIEQMAAVVPPSAQPVNPGTNLSTPYWVRVTIKST